MNNIRSSCSSSTQDQPHKIKKGLNSQYSRFIPRLAAVLCYYGSAWNERVGQSWGWSYPQVWKLLGWFTSHRSVQVQVWCAWVIIPVHGNDGGLVGVKVDETVAGGLTRELVRHHLEGEGNVRKYFSRTSKTTGIMNSPWCWLLQTLPSCSWHSGRRECRQF